MTVCAGRPPSCCIKAIGAMETVESVLGEIAGTNLFCAWVKQVEDEENSALLKRCCYASFSITNSLPFLHRYVSSVLCFSYVWLCLSLMYLFLCFC